MLWTLDLFWSTVSVRWEFVDETLGKPKKHMQSAMQRWKFPTPQKKHPISHAPHSPKATLIETNPRRRSFWLAGREVCIRVWRRFAHSMNRKTWFTPHWAATGTKLSKTIGCWRIVRFWGAVLRFHPKRVALSSTFRYSPTHEYELSGRFKEKRRGSSLRFNSQSWARRVKATPGDRLPLRQPSAAFLYFIPELSGWVSMALRGPLSRLLRSSLSSCQQSRSQSVAILGAPFSKGQVRNIDVFN